MMPFPEVVKVGYADYKCELWHSLDASAFDRKGECCRSTKVIRVRNDMPGRETAQTLLHEILHAAYYDSRLESGDTEERIVGTLAHVIAQVYRDNPEAMQFIAEQLA